MKLLISLAVTTILVIGLGFMNLLVNQNYLFLLSGDIIATTYPSQFDGHITAQTTFYPTINQANCCPGYIFQGDSCYWPSTDYDEAAKKWNNTVVVLYNNTDTVCPSFTIHVDIPDDDVLLPFWIFSIMVIIANVATATATKVLSLTMRINHKDLYCICCYVWIVTMFCYMITYAAIGNVPVTIPFDYVEISQSNPWPVNLLTYALICIFVIYQVVVIADECEKIQQTTDVETKQTTDIEMK